MPLYEYECEACGQRFEVIQKFSDPPVEKCTRCGKSPVRQLLSSPAIHFKGSGWYITDYAKKDKTGESSETAKGDGTKSEAAKPDAAKTDAAPSSSSPKTDAPAPTPASSSTPTKD